jgi:hypothetical protein
LRTAVDAGLDGRLVVGRCVLAKEVLQDVGGHDRVALDGLDEVLAHDEAGKVLVDLLVELRLLGSLVCRLPLDGAVEEVGGDHVEIGLFSHVGRP